MAKTILSVEVYTFTSSKQWFEFGKHFTVKLTIERRSCYCCISGEDHSEDEHREKRKRGRDTEDKKVEKVNEMKVKTEKHSSDESSPKRMKRKTKEESQERESLSEEDVPSWNGGDLGRFFHGKKFYIKDDIEDKDERETLRKYIIGHCG